MNQILVNKKNNKKKYFFKIQLIISIIIVLISIIIVFINYNKDEGLENISEIIDKNIKLTNIYVADAKSNYHLYLGKIVINKINLDYIIFNEYNDELLKIAPCKFYGGRIGEKGNICIAAHNYNDNRFFSRIAELKKKDEIKLIDLEGKEYQYIVYDNFEIDENDFSILKASKNYDLTLLTCNNINKRRVIIKAYMKEYWKKYALVVKL